MDMETLLKGVCDKANFIDLLENFILFDDSAGEAKKILARNHQFLGVNRAITAVRLAIHDFLWSDATGLPVERYTEDDVKICAEKIFHHIIRVYPTLPSPYYQI